MLWPHGMNTTVCGEVNMYSPQIGQSQSVDRSMQRCDSRIAIERQAEHFYDTVSQRRKGSGVGPHLAVEKILTQTFTDATDPTVIAMVYAFLGVVVPKLA